MCFNNSNTAVYHSMGNSIRHPIGMAIGGRAAASISEAATRVRRKRQIHSRIPVEKAEGLEHEAHVFHGHHGKILRAGHVGDPKAVPNHRV